MTPFARKIDPTTRDVVCDATRATWDAAESPEFALVSSVLATPQGRRLAKPLFGVKWPSKGTANVAATTRQAILDALRPYIARGTLRAVDAVVSTQGEALFYDVSFTGRDGQHRNVSGQR